MYRVAKLFSFYYYFCRILINYAEFIMETISRRKQYGWVAMDILIFVVLAFVFMLFLSMPFSVLFIKELGVTGSIGNVPVLIINEAIMLVSVFLSAWIVLWLRKCPLTSLGLSVKGRGKDLLAGMAFAAMLYAVGFGISLLSGAVEVTGVNFQPATLLLSFTFFLLVAIAEELAVRGFILGRMLDGGVNKYGALVISSLLFSLMHIFNPNFAFLPFLNIFLAGLLLGASYIFTRNLCFPITLHWFWNWLQGPVLGYEVSGNDFGTSLLTLHVSQANILNGGTFGFEGSIICTVLMIAGTLLIIRHYAK